MIMRTAILEHYDWLDYQTDDMDFRSLAVFGVACAERDWPVYSRASQEKPWEKRALLRSALDSIWGWLLGNGNRPQGYFEACQEASLEEAYHDTDSMANAAAIVNMYLMLFHGVENSDPAECNLGQSNIELVRSFVYALMEIPDSYDSEFVISDHMLVRDEIRRQREDLAALKTKPFRPSLVQEVLARSKEHSIFGSYWYK